MTRRGVAMILVLGASVVLLTAAAAIARTRVNQQLRTQSDAGLAVAMAVADAADEPIRAWLRAESAGVALAPDIQAPWTGIMQSELQILGEPVVVDIAAWDQYGMVPQDTDASPGLRIDTAEPAWTGSQYPGLDEAALGSSVYPSRTYPDRLGGIVATHSTVSAGRRGSSAGMAAINVNTAPVWLLEALLPPADRPLIGTVMAARSAGEPVDVAGLRTGTFKRVRLIGSSPAWAFRIDVQTRAARVSFWSVYTRSGGVWVREQRLVIYS